MPVREKAQCRVTSGRRVVGHPEDHNIRMLPSCSGAHLEGDSRNLHPKDPHIDVVFLASSLRGQESQLFRTSSGSYDHRSIA